eukprot:TRINITY_DN9585_c0_g1_i1.p1 TRINITY_DN9585_c0_g1~~TRINITY_DN9585_c0_g1_i1.p1  ORF type:complete len:339 (+),score=58.62 TRINITY_DN9585_c0_g1_i1:88-1104(+)
MRRSLRRLCAAAAPATSPAAAPLREWVRLPHNPWDYPELREVPMWRCGGGTAPGPVLVLTGAGGCAALSQLCGCMQFEAGCVGLDLPTRDPDADWCLAQGELVVQFLDVLGAPWAHVVAHSVGALLAVFLCHTAPGRIGSLTVLDTPLLSPGLQRHATMRAELQRAQRDVNVPDETVAELGGRLAEPEALPACPDKADAQLWDALLKGERSKDGREKRDWVLPVDALELVQHPMLLLRPKQKPQVTDELLGVHRDLFNVQVVAPEDAGDHGALLRSAGAAAAVDKFATGFSTQHIVEKEFAAARARRIGQAALAGQGKPQGDKDKGDAKADKKRKKDK